jgi:hypothetical protein
MLSRTYCNSAGRTTPVPSLFSIVVNSHVIATHYMRSIYFSILGILFLFLTFEAGVFNMVGGQLYQ